MGKIHSKTASVLISVIKITTFLYSKWLFSCNRGALEASTSLLQVAREVRAPEHRAPAECSRALGRAGRRKTSKAQQGEAAFTGDVLRCSLQRFYDLGWVHNHEAAALGSTPQRMRNSGTIPPPGPVSRPHLSVLPGFP